MIVQMPNVFVIEAPKAPLTLILIHNVELRIRIDRMQTEIEDLKCKYRTYTFTNIMYINDRK